MRGWKRAGSIANNLVRRADALAGVLLSCEATGAVYFAIAARVSDGRTPTRLRRIAGNGRTTGAAGRYNSHCRHERSPCMG